MYFRRLMLVSGLAFLSCGATPGLAQQEAYLASLRRSLSKYGQALPETSLNWLARTFGKTPEQIRADLAQAAGVQPTATDRLQQIAEQVLREKTPGLAGRVSGLVGGEKMIQSLPALGQLQSLVGGAAGKTTAPPAQVNHIYGSLLTQLLGYFQSANLVPAPLLQQIGSLMGKAETDVLRDLVKARLSGQMR